MRTITPAPAAAGRVYDLPGRTEPYESAAIFTRANGIVRERRFDIGDVVKAGDVLAVIELPEIDRAVDAARASVEQAEVRAKNARTAAKRATALFSSEAISVEESEQRAANADELDAAVRVARAELARLEEQQKFGTVRAPFDGVIAARNFDRGDRVRGDAATADGWLYRLVRLDVLRFAVAATPDIALRLRSDGAVAVRFNEFPGRTFPAKVARTSRVFDAASGTSRVELLLDNADLLLPAGLTGTAAFDVASAPGTFMVPTNTLLTRSGRTAVATVHDGKVTFQEVIPGRNLGPKIELTSTALTTATQIIINPNALLRAGDAVNASPLTGAN